MTRKEAIDILKNTIVQFGRTNGKTAYAEALQMAIKALEQPEIIHCRECKHWKKTIGDECWSLGDCDVFDKKLVMCEGFCGWAERREK